MKVHIVPASDFTAFQQWLIAGLTSTKNKVEPTTPLPPCPAPQRPTFPENRMEQEGSISAAFTATAIRDIRKAQFVSSHDLDIQSDPPENIHRGTADQILAQVRRNKAAAASSLPLDSSSLASCVSSQAYYTSAKALDLIGQIVADKRITPAQAIAAITGITDQTLFRAKEIVEESIGSSIFFGHCPDPSDSSR